MVQYRTPENLSADIIDRRLSGTTNNTGGARRGRSALGAVEGRRRAEIAKFKREQLLAEQLRVKRS